MERKNDLTPETLREWLAEDTESDPNAGLAHHTEQALLEFAAAHAAEPAPELRERILGNIFRLIQQDQSAETIDLANPPLLTPLSNWKSWETAVAQIHPPDELENIHLHPIRSDETVEIFVAFVREFIPEEVHTDILESFILLEGTCECIITDPAGVVRTVHMREGDYIAFRVGETHEIYITSADRPAKAILQWMKLAA
ncbi:MAG: hypothetical protein SFV52_08245 [Saprospiraceae bacterium]|nr:hypothetical protein [Saprospiraceae bacterium]